MDTLNLSKYTDEIANIIVNSLTEKDIEFYTEVMYKLMSKIGRHEAQQIILQLSFYHCRVFEKNIHDPFRKHWR